LFGGVQRRPILSLKRTGKTAGRKKKGGKETLLHALRKAFLHKETE
jgi:hypothetical protein